ncbi:MAG: hypothetical protein ACKV2U_05830 [Bryobacteraceae bacterium]
MAKCAICDVRNGKRYCTARGEDICTQCCAAEREVTINCPFECGYLRESRLHEKRPLNQAGMPHRDVKIDNDFLKRSEMVLMLMAAFMNQALRAAPNATDRDAREAMEALIAAFREGKEVTPEGEVAAGIVVGFREKMGVFIKELQDREAGPFADRVFLGVLVFMSRVAYGYDNGKPHSRAYVHYLRETFPEGAA